MSFRVNKVIDHILETIHEPSLTKKRKNFNNNEDTESNGKNEIVSTFKEETFADRDLRGLVKSRNFYILRT